MTQTSFSREDDSGVYLPIIAACIIAIMTVLGWAVDSASLFVANLTAQRAADAAAIAGAAKLALEGPDMPATLPAVDPFDSQVEDAARSIAFQNLILGGVKAANIVPIPNAVVNRIAPPPAGGRSRLTVTVDVTVQAPLYILRFVPGFGPTSIVRATSTTEVLPAMVALILDGSGSMDCVNGATNCNCAPNCPTSPGNPRRIDRLVDAVNNYFLPHFDQTRDIISVTTFNRVASTIVAANPAGGFNRASMQTTISSVVPQGPTNLCDAQFTAYRSIQASAAANPDLQTAYVAFSDGASTAMRGSFVNPRPALPDNNPTGIYPYDYYFWGAEWRVSGDLDGSGNQRVHVGVSRLAAATPSGCNDGGCTNSPACSTLSFAGLSGTENGATELGTCLRNLRFRDPGGNVYPTRVAGLPSTFGTIVNTNSWNWRFMDCAVALSDYMRTNRGIWFTIGLGAINPISAAADPYQTPGAQVARKDNLLSRIAFEYVPAFDFPGFISYNTLSSDVTQTHGEYYPTPTDTDLPQIFQSVAQQIKIRLIS